ncbi:glycoside hydrolase family 92 protein [Zasmidium cellare ATCC 36951]|uniref:Glycoside hydrolase family 92 protein n=1 Tax=Zasmidium cellare ATCC 36951 TaxID=1080233 RepID=A0A6A6CU40_ZASCE|nr:glycoside hydrolase family 92 protein [Zasmidium cellare ATCC 36951]KAF2169680.1 glycoside hydrolase family 92 protein [Zasmidium cellare ATCC 36951]
MVDYSQYVSVFIGSEGPVAGTTAGGGDIWVGAAVPFGAVRFGLDTTAADGANSFLNGGWTPDGNVTAVSALHVHGTGGGAKYGVIPQMPLTTLEGVNLLDNMTYSQPRKGHDEGSVGYFSSRLENGVHIELSATQHTGLMQYSFPRGEKHVVVDVSHYLPSPPIRAQEQKYVGGEIKLHSEGNLYTGYGTYIGGWNYGAPMTIYFCGEFSVPPTNSQIFSGYNNDPVSRYQTCADCPTPQAVLQSSASSAHSGPWNDRVGVLFTWNETSAQKISSKVGISWISTDRACQFKDTEIKTWDLNTTVQAAVEEWNREVFSKVQVDTGPSSNRTDLELLYSSLYFMHLMPSDRTGENPLWETSEPWWDDFYTFWDLFRCTTALWHLLQPRRYEGMIRALIEMYRRQGYMPDGRSGNFNGETQGGSNADNVLADAYVKGLRGGINWTDGYAAMVKDAEVVPFSDFPALAVRGSSSQGRAGLANWKRVGFLAADQDDAAVSRTVEYSANDFALSQVARGEKPGDVEKYLNRSAGWQRLWSDDVTSLNVTGFLAPRLANGAFNLTSYDPLSSSPYTTEGSPWEYTLTAAHDMASLIAKAGGPTSFSTRLDTMFLPNPPGLANLGVNGAGIDTIMNIGNEPDFAVPYLYHYLNASWKSVHAARNLAETRFNTTAQGLPGNSDAGALNSWLVWQMLGLWPVAGQPVYLLGAPRFRDLRMAVGVDGSRDDGTVWLRIRAPELSGRNRWVGKVWVDGRTWTRNWFEHGDVMVRGGEIVFEMTDEPVVWETGGPPPSPGHVEVEM